MKTSSVLKLRHVAWAAAGVLLVALLSSATHSRVKPAPQAPPPPAVNVATYLDVLDSQRSLLEAQLTLAQARNNEYQSLAQLYKPLGGGWK